MQNQIHKKHKIIISPLFLFAYVPTFCSNSHFPVQISNYKLALQGPVAYLDHYDVCDPLSCKAVFQQLPYRKKLHHLNIYIIVCWRELNQIGPSSHIPSHVTNSAASFHLLKLSHVFPANNNVSPFFSVCNNR
jgi:hypothetical protein